jgi:hypothetical protein
MSWLFDWGGSSSGEGHVGVHCNLLESALQAAAPLGLPSQELMFLPRTVKVKLSSNTVMLDFSNFRGVVGIVDACGR